MKTKKDLKEEYKQIKPRMGVFQIRNTSSGKIFIGSSINLDAMRNRCKMQLDWGNHPNAELQRDWKETGEAGFVFEVISDLKYRADDMNNDYKQEIKLLEKMVLENMSNEGTLLY
ncbi:GIY-YIG nuclease family protein [Ignavibacteria bacterium]|nr:GIY-YIG nuclease family protein [Bacteroidota bacterium]MCZ2133177.1 GIY-YIG nuclease family protein [Bacteroidota bacterium]